MKIVTWNVNGIRSFDGKWDKVLESLEADIVCIQETKVTRGMLDEPTALIPGYSSYFAFSRKRTGYSGVATFCKSNVTPICAEEGLSGLFAPDKDSVGHYQNLNVEFSQEELKNLDSEGRCVLTLHQIEVDNELQKLAIFNLYCPRADPEKPERIVYQQKFHKLVELRARNLIDQGIFVIVLGDLNVSHKEIDHCDPYEEFGEKPSRKWMEHLLNGAEFEDQDHEWKIQNVPDDQKHKCILFDAFRHFHAEEKNAFTCWNTEKNCRSTNYGTRIDYILASQGLKGCLFACDIHPDVLGSDHCPVSAQFDCLPKTLNGDKAPSWCTKYFPEFSGSQQKLSAFFRPEKRKIEDQNGHSKPTKKKATVQQSSMFKFLTKTQTSELRTEGKDAISSLFCQQKMEDNGKRAKAASAWKDVMKGPPAAPLCKGHRESCVLRTVKKKGPNLNRQFWCCPKGEGRSDDPNARCDFFKWLK